MKNKFNVAKGQIWQDNDPRYEDEYKRTLEVLEVDGDYAICKNIQSGRTSKIKLSRFKPTSTGYRLIKDAK